MLFKNLFVFEFIILIRFFIDLNERVFTELNMEVSPCMRCERQAGVARGGQAARAAGLKVLFYFYVLLPWPLRTVLMPRACPSFLAAHPSCQGKLCGAERYGEQNDRPDIERNTRT